MIGDRVSRGDPVPNPSERGCQLQHSVFNGGERFAVGQAMQILREVMDSHWDLLTAELITRLNEAINDIDKAKKILEEISDHADD